VAESIKYWYNTTKSFRRECGLQGREYFRSSQSGLSASEMGTRMIQSINMLFENWNPRTRVELFKL